VLAASSHSGYIFPMAASHRGRGAPSRLARGRRGDYVERKGGRGCREGAMRRRVAVEEKVTIATVVIRV
jgi:hypothetical protein